jgi:hypothetical protein
MFCLIGALPAAAQTSMEYAKMGQKIWPAFQCSIAAEHIGDNDEQKRLWTLAHESGKAFLNAANEGKVKRADIRETVAIAVTMRMRGPSVDFVMGSVWEAAANKYYDELGKECENCASDDELKKIHGKINYGNQNCALLN